MLEEIEMLLAKQNVLTAAARLDILVDEEKEKLNENHRFELLASNAGLAKITFLESVKEIIRELNQHPFLNDTFEWREKHLNDFREQMPKSLTIDNAIKGFKKTTFELLRLVFLKHMSLLSIRNLILMNPENELSLGSVSEEEIELLDDTLPFLNFAMDLKPESFWRRIFKGVRTR